jgi:hypothetical protein
MPITKQLSTADEWAPYLKLLEELHGRLEMQPWFKKDWKVICSHVPAGNRVIFILTKDKWCDGAIYFKTRLTNSDLKKGLVRVGLHVETSLSKDGIHRIVFDEYLLKHSGAKILSWEGHVINSAHHQKPFHIWIPFTGITLVSSLEDEFSRLQQLGPVIDQAINAAKPS